MLGCIRKVYRYSKSNRKKIQNMREEINILKEEIANLKEDNLKIKIWISSQDAINNNDDFAKVEHIYEVIKYDKNKDDEINILKEEIANLKEDNLKIKIWISSQNAISNDYYFAKDKHIYEEIKYDKIKDNETTSWKPVINDVPPQLPPRNKINSIKA